MSIKLKGSSDGSVSFDAPADTSPSGSDITLTLPTSAGSADQFLKNSGIAGELEYSSMVEDSSGRLLVGTSSSSTNDTLVLQGNSAGSTFGAQLRLRRNATIGSGSGIGDISFEDGSGNQHAVIGGAGDGTSGSDDYPGRLVFKTTADGASSPTERMRIDSSGRLGLGTASPQRNVHFNSSTTEVALKLTNSTSGSATGDGTDIKYEGSNLSINNRESGSITFETSNAARMEIDSDGSQQNYRSSAGTVINSRTGQSGFSASTFRGYESASSTTTGTASFVVFANGNVQNKNNSYGQISDVKLKENIVDANSQWDDLKAFRIRNWNFKPETGYATHTQIGVVAQEVEAVSPGLVYETPDRDGEGVDLGTVTKGVNYSVLYMKAVKALQEAQTRIETLESQHADLLARVTALEAA